MKIKKRKEEVETKKRTKQENRGMCTQRKEGLETKETRKE